MAGAAAAQEGPRLILGRYRPIQPLGSGGSGTVWLVRDVLEERDVALKVVPREGKAGERAEREAHAVARLRSRHCARAYAVQRDDRHVYVTYEYVPGKTMREAITLVPDLHVCVVARGQVVETVPELFARLAPSAGEGRPIVLVSGPSATSDLGFERVELDPSGYRRGGLLTLAPHGGA